MENPTILVADGDPKNLQILRDSLEASGFEVIVATDGLQAWQKISSEVPDLILSEVNLPQLDGFQLLEKLKADPATSAIPLMFLTNRRELQDRVRSLRGGVKDYMIKPLHVKEVLARIRMILRRMERIKEEEIDSSRKLAGRLEEFSPVDLIESFGVERKTGVLTLNNENNRSGEIYFREGAVVNAALGTLKAEKAVYQMLPWKRGHFTMIFKEINVADEISVSNLGLLLQGFKRIEERERLFKQLPSPETTFVMTETFRSIMDKREASPEVAKFVGLIDGRRDILQIIDESTYDDIKTLERLVKLYQQGFIKPGKPATRVKEEKTDFPATLAEPKIVQKILQQPPEARKRSTFTPEPRVVDLPPFRPDLNLPALAAETPAENGDAKNHENLFIAPPLAPEDFSDPFAKESLERAGELERADAKDDRISEADALAAQALEATAEDDDIIEIREVPSSSDSDFAPSSEVERLLRSAGRGLSPELEPDLLPLDLGEIMKRPVAPPPFFTEHNGSGNGNAAKHFTPLPSAPISNDAKPIAPEIVAKQSEIITNEPDEQINAEPESPFNFSLQEFATPAHIAEPSATEQPEPFEPLDISPIVDLRKEEKRGVEFVEPAAPETLAPFEPLEVSPIITLAKDEKPLVEQSEPAPNFAAQMRELPLAPFAPAKPEPVITPQFELAIAAQAEPQLHATSNKNHDADSITAALRKLAQRRNLQRPKLLVIGRESRDISAFVQNTLGADSSLRKRESATFQHFEIGERKLMGQPCEVIGISMEQPFTKLLAATARELSAYVMLVEAHRRQELTYLSYLLSALRTSYRLPFGLAMIRSKEHKNLSKETIRDLLNLAETDYLHECNPGDVNDVAAFLFGLASEECLARFAEK